MDKFVKPGKYLIMLLLFLMVIALYCISLYDLQVVQGKDYYALSTGTTTTTTTVSAARGAILDRNGTVLVSSVTSYNVMLTRDELMMDDDPNGQLLDMIYFALENNQSYTDTLPITISPPFSYTTMSEIQEYRFQKYCEYMELDKNISASDFIVWLREHYGLDYTTSLKDARLIIGLRYELEMRYIVNINPYIFVEDADSDFVAAILEKNYPGISIAKTTKRQYNTKYASHLLGYIGYMNEEEYETYKELGYGMNTYVGKDGVEKAFEEYLHGKDGEIETTRNENGEIIDVTTVSQAEAGNNVYLTINIGLQAAAENALNTTITALNTSVEDGESKATGGSAVAVDVKTGEVLACASYPNYDPATFLENYNSLVNDSTNPLYFRATMGTYNPGSTFKPITALTGLRTGNITPTSTFTCDYVYDKYAADGLTLYCWDYDGHGEINVIGALGFSCNIFFYNTALACGPTAIAETAEKFGLGDYTGIEIPESQGQRATIDYKMTLFDEDSYDYGWYDADTLMDGIGQSFNYYTTLQMANYVATIGNGGILHKLTLLDRVTSADFVNIITESDPVVRTDSSEELGGYLEIIHEGMRKSATEGTGADIFADYKIEVATKTGTTQSDATSTNSGVFICFAPLDDPEIAIAVTVENGKSGASIMGVAKEMLDYYFSDSMSETFQSEYQLLP